jgi:5-methylcytosine-specific restriction protein A
MPTKPKHPCNQPDCAELTTGRYCEAHTKQEQHRYNHQQRDPETQKRYGAAWRRVRAAYVAKHPLCELCLAEGILVPCEEVHHKAPLSDGGTHAHSNLQALCKSCHSEITARDGGRWG